MDALVLRRYAQRLAEVHAGCLPDLSWLTSRCWRSARVVLFLPDLPDDEPGKRLRNLEHAPLAEIMGRIHRASEVFNRSAPEAGAQ